jgi:hypothetical protein
MGITIGTQYMLNENHGPIIDFTTILSGDISAQIYGFGYKYSKPINDKLSIGVIPKFGLAQITTDLGKLEAHGIMPILTTGKTYRKGDKIESEASGTVMSLEIEADYTFTKEIAGFFKLGYQKSSFKKPITKIAGSEVTDPKAFDEGKLNGSTLVVEYESNIDPFKDVEINMDGMILSFGANYKF